MHELENVTLSRRTALGMIGAALLAPKGAIAAERPYFAIDAMAPSELGFDGRVAARAGMSAAVVDLQVPVRDAVAIGKELARWRQALAAPGRSCDLVLRDGDFDQAIADGRCGIVLACQDPAILGTPDAIGNRNVDALKCYHDQGMRVLQLSYTDRSMLGDGYRETTDAGLSHLGEKIIDAMNQLGMVIDVSHCGDRTTNEAIRRSQRPIAITHAGARALFASGRNKSDETIRLLADRGGFFGVFNMTMWLTDRPMSSVENIVDHMMHVRNVGGSGIVGFGSDFRVPGDKRPQPEKVADMQSWVDANNGFPGGEGMHGHMSASDMDGPDKMLVLQRALEKRKLPAAEVEAILGLNFRRVFRDVCG